MFADPTWGFAMPAAYRRGDSGEESLLLRGIRGFGRRRARKMRKTTMRAARARLKRLKSNPATRFCWPATAAATQSMQGVRSTKDKN